LGGTLLLKPFGADLFLETVSRVVDRSGLPQRSLA
jgi:hypothetical protein